jgi:hypothetical protein
VIGAFFDPQFRLHRIDEEMQLQELEKEQLEKEIKGNLQFAYMELNHLC